MTIKERFIKDVVEQFKKTHAEGEKVYREYVNNKIIKIDVVSNSFTLVHWVFWESDVIQNAIDA